MNASPIDIRIVDPQAVDAMALLREAAIEARELYPELFSHDSPWPTNPPTPDRGVYLVAYLDDKAVACGAIRPLDTDCAEVHRIFVAVRARRNGLASLVLSELEQQAIRFGYRRLRLETGFRQTPAMALYRTHGYRSIDPFGPYIGDPTSVCFEKVLDA